MKKRKFNIVVAIYIMVGIILCALVGNALAKYFQTSSNPSTFKAMDFYFESELLDGEIHEISPGLTSVEFTVRNYADVYRISEVNVIVTGITITGEGTPAISYNSAETVLKKEDGAVELAVTASGLVPGKTYTISATARGIPSDYTGSTGGYEKTITGTIKVPPAEDVLYKSFQKFGSYVLLTVWSEGYMGNDVTITVPAGVIPDNTDEIMSSWTTDGIFVDSTTFAGKQFASHTYRFFVTEGSVSAESFVVKYNGGDNTATNK